MLLHILNEVQLTQVVVPVVQGLLVPIVEVAHVCADKGPLGQVVQRPDAPALRAGFEELELGEDGSLGHPVHSDSGNTVQQ